VTTASSLEGMGTGSVIKKFGSVTPELFPREAVAEDPQDQSKPFRVEPPPLILARV